VKVAQGYNGKDGEVHTSYDKCEKKGREGDTYELAELQKNTISGNIERAWT